MSSAKRDGSKKGRKKKGLADVINEKRIERDWSQAKLAEEAGLSQPALSRLLSKDGDPKPAHLWSLAQALEMSLLQLASDAGIDDVLSEVVPRDLFVEMDKRRSEAQAEVATLKTQLAAKDAEAKRLGATLEERSHEIVEAKKAIRGLEVAASEVDGLREEVRQLELRDDRRQAELQSKAIELSGLVSELDSSHARVVQLEGAIGRMQAKAHHLEHDLKTAKNQTAVLGAVAGFTAIGAGIWLAGKPNGRRG